MPLIPIRIFQRRPSPPDSCNHNPSLMASIIIVSIQRVTFVSNLGTASVEAPIHIQRWSDHRKLLISTTLLLASPRVSINCFPLEDHSKSKIRPALNLVNCRGSPPATGCSHKFVVPLLVRRYCNPC